MIVAQDRGDKTITVQLSIYGVDRSTSTRGPTQRARSNHDRITEDITLVRRCFLERHFVRYIFCNCGSMVLKLCASVQPYLEIVRLNFRRVVFVVVRIISITYSKYFRSSEFSHDVNFSRKKNSFSRTCSIHGVSFTVWKSRGLFFSILCDR